jgi:tetratricopeptide (TPR) repeat protein
MAKSNKPMSQKEVEKSQLDLNKLLASQKFESIEDMQKFLNEHVMGKPIDQTISKFGQKETNQEKATNLAYQAHEAPSKNKAMEIIKKALIFDPNCVEAHIFLGEHEQDPRKAVVFFQKALNQAQKDIGEKAFEEFKGDFWGYHETRPFMRAKERIADCFLAMDDFDAGCNIYLEMLELNPDDNQGVRYRLAPILVWRNRWTDYEKIYKIFNDDSEAGWLYTYAIYLFKKEGESSKKAKKALIEAFEANPHLLVFLSGSKKIPKQLPPYIQPGEESEALHAINMTMMLWAEEGVLGWVVDIFVKETTKRESK